MSWLIAMNHMPEEVLDLLEAELEAENTAKAAKEAHAAWKGAAKAAKEAREALRRARAAWAAWKEAEAKRMEAEEDADGDTGTV